MSASFEGEMSFCVGECRRTKGEESSSFLEMRGAVRQKRTIEDKEAELCGLDWPSFYKTCHGAERRTMEYLW